MSWVVLGLLILSGLVVVGLISGVSRDLLRARNREQLEAIPPQQRAAMTLVALADGSLTVALARKYWPLADDVPDIEPYVEYITISRAFPGISADGADRFGDDVRALMRGEWTTDRFPMGIDPDAPTEDEDEEEDVNEEGGDAPAAAPPAPDWMATIPFRRPDPADRDVQAVLGLAVCMATLCAVGGAEIDGSKGDTGAETTRHTARALADLLGAGRFLTDRQRKILHSPLPVGHLRPDLALEAYWYGDGAAVLLWALGLLPEVPPSTVSVDPRAMMQVLPMSQEAARGLLERCRLRPRDELVAMHERLRDERLRTRVADDLADERASIVRSRALERYRAIRWLLEERWPDIEATPADPLDGQAT
jgi:hypothetical protein